MSILIGALQNGHAICAAIRKFASRFHKVNSVVGEHHTAASMGEIGLKAERLAMHHTLTNDRAKAIEYGDLASQFAEKTMDLRFQAQVFLTRARHEYIFGDYRAGILIGQQTVRIAKRASNFSYEAQGSGVQARCFARLGNCARASQYCALAVNLLSALGLDQMSLVGRNMLNLRAETLLQQTEYRKTRDICTVMRDVGRESNIDEVQLGNCLINLTVIDVTMY
ncbi:hypothetical protein C8J57DRAFT_1652015 [Mycena rebaudengoi]|nr:hypothetical protein C8J57DRAFT_1652015 [Mycena rebaudengoi]